jgi:hypothetical protein
MTSVQLARAEIRDGNLRFETADGWRDALTRGIFYLKSPDGLDCAAAVRLCESFYLERTGDAADEYKGFRRASFDGSVLGYSDAGKDQVERIQLELRLWERYLPAAVSPVLHRFNDMARTVIRGVFTRCGVEPAHVAQITGGMETNEALQYCIFNNFESRKLGADGFTPHKDSGFVQIMYSPEPGLELWEAERWTPIEPVPGYLMAISGHALEILTARLATRAAAAYHRVRSIETRPAGRKDRTSFGVYIGPRFEQDLFQYDDGGRLTRFKSFMAFQKEKAAEMGYEFSNIHPALGARA